MEKQKNIQPNRFGNHYENFYMIQTPLPQAIKTTSRHLRRLKEMGVNTVGDFLMYLPRGYTDAREVKKIAEMTLGETNTVRAKLLSFTTKPSFRGRMAITTALFEDDSGSLQAVWFNQAFLSRVLQTGKEYVLSGKIKAEKGRVILQNPVHELVKPNLIHMARIVPVYPETELELKKIKGARTGGRLSSKWIREKLFPLMRFAPELPELLEEKIRREYELLPLAEAVQAVHFPGSEQELAAGRRRLGFDELFFLQLAALYRKLEWRRIHAEAKKQIPADWELMKSFTATLPWPLTRAQKKSIYQILSDMEKPYPMSRLLEGDVGSGKTVVAAAAILAATRAGFQTCVLAPTEILARQHLKTLQKLLEPFQISPRLLVGAMPAAEKQQLIAEISAGEVKLAVGTHALLQEKITFKNLGLAIIDEQHRFGVRQRETLKAHGSPHMLLLTATPIPRTLALVLYGEHDLSVLDEMPPGRKPVTTRIVPEGKRNSAYAWIDKELEKGRQAFIIFPLIEESEVLQVKAAASEWQRLSQEIFPNRRVGLLHGQMKPEDKDSTMEAFRSHKLDILVSTAVVEVGVDVPNATMMMIEGAERFGLAQLHQFRGRVGRGEHESFCFLFPSAPEGRSLQNFQVLKRLEAVVKHHCGFQLAEIDLHLRGPGAIYGIQQSGIPDLRMANLSDGELIAQAREAAEKILQGDPELKNHPELRAKIAEQENVAIDY